MRNGVCGAQLGKAIQGPKVQETFVDTFALAGAIVSIQLAFFMFLFSRQHDSNPALVWWAAALSVEAIRLGLIAISSTMPGMPTDLIGDGGHAPVSLLMLAGCLRFTGDKRHYSTFLIGALFIVGVIFLGAILPLVAPLAEISLLVVATAAFATMLWVFRSLLRTDEWYGYAAVTIPLLFTTAYLIGDTVSAIDGLGATGTGFYEGIGYEWADIGDLGLSLFTLTSLLIVAQQRENLLSHRAKVRIEASEQRFRDIAEVAADWIWETGSDLRFNFFSDRLEQVTGLKSVDLFRKTNRGLLGGDPSDSAWQSHVEDLDARRPFRNYEYALVGADGKVRHVRINGKPVYDADDNFLGYKGVLVVPERAFTRAWVTSGLA